MHADELSVDKVLIIFGGLYVIKTRPKSQCEALITLVNNLFIISYEIDYKTLQFLDLSYQMKFHV